MSGDYNPLASLGASGLNKIYNGRRPIAKSSAATIVKHLDKEKFEAYISQLSLDAIDKLSVALQANGIKAESQSAASVCSGLFIDILTKCAKGEDSPVSAVEKREDSTNVESTYETEGRNLRLLIETRGYCPNDNCAEPLLIMQNNKSLSRYKVTRIRPDESAERYDNLIALCPKCHDRYTLASSAEEANRLARIKTSLMRESTAMESAAEVKIESGVADVIRKISSSQGELIPLNYEPVAIIGKIHGDNGVLLRKTLFHVNTYFNYVKEVFQLMSKEGLLRFEALSAQIRLCYLNERDKGLSQQEIYDALVEWLRTMTNESRDACEIVIAYFVQNCEVFDAIAK